MDACPGEDTNVDASRDSSGIRICFDVSGIRCVTGAAALERELSTVDGVLHAAVRARRDRLCVEMSRLAPVDAVVRLLSSCGCRIGEGLVQVTAWVDTPAERLKELKQGISEWPCVAYCEIHPPTGRVDFGLRLREDWQTALPELCRCLCAAREPARIAGSLEDEPAEARPGTLAQRSETR